MNMTRMYMYILANKCWITWKFVSSEAKGSFSTPKNDRWPVIRVVCFLNLITESCYTTQNIIKFSILSKHCVYALLPWAVEKPIIQILQEAAYYYSQIFGPGLAINSCMELIADRVAMEIICKLFHNCMIFLTMHIMISSWILSPKKLMTVLISN